MLIKARFSECREVEIDDATAREIAVAQIVAAYDLRDATEIHDGFLGAHVEDGMGGTYEAPRRPANFGDVQALAVIKRLRTG